MAKDDDIGEIACKFSQPAGSYYDMLPWRECAKMDYSMCDVDAGRECRFQERGMSNE